MSFQAGQRHSIYEFESSNSQNCVRLACQREPAAAIGGAHEVAPFAPLFLAAGPLLTTH